jgi:hypothetical protein
MPRIFISHSSHDQDLAGEICGDLRTAGYEPWMDCQSIRAGSPIIANIDAAITKCHHFIVVLSKKAVESQWVEEEVTSSLWAKLSDRRRKQLIPALREECGDLPLYLKNLRYANFTQSYAVGFAQIYAAIDLPPIEDRWPCDVLPPDQLVALERDACHPHDHIRFAIAHTIWSIRPDRAKYILENQLGDWRDYVNRHARLLLDRYY